jgi:hypothetical protein
VLGESDTQVMQTDVVLLSRNLDLNIVEVFLG